MIRLHQKIHNSSTIAYIWASKIMGLKSRIIGIMLILGLVAPLVLSYHYLRVQKKLIRKEVKYHLIEQTKLDDLVLLRFSIAESQEKLKWKHEKEFEFEGEMYDIVERENRGDSLFFWCWWDHEETQLNRQLDILLAQTLGGHSDHHSQQQRIKHFLQNLYLVQADYTTKLDTKDHLPSPSYVFILKSADAQPPIQPPESTVIHPV